MFVEKPPLPISSAIGLRGVLVIGDMHYTGANSNDTDPIEQDILRMIDGGIDTLILLGDVFHTHEKLSAEAQSRFTLFVKSVIERRCYMICLVGNHDMASNKDWMPTTHSMTALGAVAHPLLHIVSRPQYFDIHGTRVLATPYVPPGRFREALELEGPVNASVIFAHQDFIGANYNGIVCRVGDVLGDDLPPVISGHIHDKQFLGRVFYTGTPYESGFSIRKRFIHHIEFHGDRIIVQPIACSYRKVERIELRNPEELSSLRVGSEKYVIECMFSRSQCTTYLQQFRNNNAGKDRSIHLTFFEAGIPTVSKSGMVRKEFIDILNEKLAALPKVHTETNTAIMKGSDFSELVDIATMTLL